MSTVFDDLSVMTEALMTLAVAAAGTTQGTATTVNGASIEVTTVPSGSGIVMPMDTLERRVYNRGANPLKVYPPLGCQWEALGANVAISVDVGTAVSVHVVSKTKGYVSVLPQFNYGVWQAREMLLRTNNSGVNVLALQNDNPNGYSSITFRGTDTGYTDPTLAFEHGALGWNIPGAYMQLEISRYTGANDPLVQPVDFRIQQTGGMDTSGGSTKLCGVTQGSATITVAANSIANGSLVLAAANTQDVTVIPPGTTVVSGGGTTTFVLSTPVLATNASIFLNFSVPTYAQRDFLLIGSNWHSNMYNWDGTTLIQWDRVQKTETVTGKVFATVAPAAGDSSTQLAPTSWVAAGPANFSAGITTAYTSSGSLTIPAKATLALVHGCAAGGGGGFGNNFATGSGGGSGAAGERTPPGGIWMPITAAGSTTQWKQGDTVTLTIDNVGGTGGTSGAKNGGGGGKTIFAPTVGPTVTLGGGGGGSQGFTGATSGGGGGPSGGNSGTNNTAGTGIGAGFGAAGGAGASGGSWTVSGGMLGLAFGTGGSGTSAAGVAFGGPDTIYSPSGGGSGGGTSSSSGLVGGIGGRSPPTSGASAGASGTTGTGGPGNNGASSTDFPTHCGLGGSGGGGGNTGGGLGGNGGFPGGGGGGGGNGGGGTGGNGGTGGAGALLVTFW